MRRLHVLLYLIIACCTINAQPKWVKKAAKAMFTVKTFDKEGAMIGSSNGFFISENGEAISNFSPFRGAAKAIVIDTQGKEYSVDCILGANDTYDVVKFRTSNNKALALSISSSEAEENTSLWLLPYSAKKAPKCIQGSVLKAESFASDYMYYTINLNIPENAISCPLLNENGEVIGILQQSFQKDDTICYAVSAKYANDLKLTGLSINDPTLKSTDIKKALPADVDQALLTLYLASGSLDSIAYRNIVDDFIISFPNSADGYMYRAQLEWNSNNFENVDNDINTAFSMAGEKKDDVHFTYAKLIFSKFVYKNNIDYNKWTLDKAINESDLAYSTNPLPIYKQLKAQILFHQEKYNEACEVYKQITDGGMRNAELFFEQARCKEMLKDTIGTIALLDSAVNTFSKPYLKEAAPYLFARAQSLQNAGKYRKAVFDYNEYEKLIATGLTDRFYYIRFKAEINGNLFQQALNDINKAIELSPSNTVYYAEKASLEIRVNLHDEAIATANEIIKIDSQNSDGYLFLGLAQCLKGDKANGKINLQKANELGDNQAQELINKYCK